MRSLMFGLENGYFPVVFIFCIVLVRTELTEVTTVYESLISFWYLLSLKPVICALAPGLQDSLFSFASIFGIWFVGIWLSSVTTVSARYNSFCRFASFPMCHELTGIFTTWCCYPFCFYFLCIVSLNVVQRNYIRSAKSHFFWIFSCFQILAPISYHRDTEKVLLHSRTLPWYGTRTWHNVDVCMWGITVGSIVWIKMRSSILSYSGFSFLIPTC